MKKKIAKILRRLADKISPEGKYLPPLNCKVGDLKLLTRVRDKNFMIFNQAKDIEYWVAFQGRLIYLYSLVLLIPEDKLPV